MADLTYIQATQEVKVVGQDSTGNNVNFVDADSNGNMQVKDYADGTPGSPIPAVAILIGGSDGTNLRSITTDTSGRLVLSSATSTIQVSNFPTTVDTNYGTVGSSTIRIAGQIGNATGAADFNSGATGAQTLRVSANISDGSGNKLTSTVNNGNQSLNIYPNPGFATASNTRVSVAATSVQLLAANSNRRYAYISNQSGNVMFLKFGAAAVVNQGIRLANNALYEITINNLWTGTVNAISSTATASSLDIFEGTI